VATNSPTEFSSVVVGFDVVDRYGERVGTVSKVNLARTCVAVKSGSRLARKPERPVYVGSVLSIDVDAFTINVAATKDQIAEAPEFRDLNDASEAAIRRYYENLTELQ